MINGRRGELECELWIRGQLTSWEGVGQRQGPAEKPQRVLRAATNRLAECKPGYPVHGCEVLGLAVRSSHTRLLGQGGLQAAVVATAAAHLWAQLWSGGRVAQCRGQVLTQALAPTPQTKGAPAARESNEAPGEALARASSCDDHTAVDLCHVR